MVDDGVPDVDVMSIEVPSFTLDPPPAEPFEGVPGLDAGAAIDPGSLDEFTSGPASTSDAGADGSVGSMQGGGLARGDAGPMADDAEGVLGLGPDDGSALEEEGADAQGASGGGAGEARATRADNLQERIRRLSSTDQQRVAKQGNLQERVALERTFGAAVWESLLSNSRLTAPEVARIAKKGTLVKPLIDVIVANAGWLSSTEVQRALLTNPRTSGAALTKVLRAMPRPDLQRVPQQTAYPMATRLAAKRVLVEG